MFLSRHNQENAVYEQQVAAAAKPLNEGAKGLAPKTPGNKQNAPKTPFKANKNDENANRTTLKTIGKGEKIDKNAFVTPANTRVRAPLGVKTANTKAVQAPAASRSQELPSAKPSSPRLRRSKIKVHGAEPQNVLFREPEERDIEYMAPREVPLPDYPDDIWPHDREYPELQGKNFTKGWWNEYAPRHEDDEEFSDWEEKLKRTQSLMKKREDTEAKLMNVTSKNAASALSSRTSKGAAPNFMASSAAARARQQPLVRKPESSEKNPRFSAAKVASNSTIGYSKGRAVSSSTRRPISQLHGPEAKPSASTSNHYHATNSATLDHLLELMLSDVPDEGPGLSKSDVWDVEDELEDFHLQLPS